MIVSDIQTRIKRQFGDESGVQVTDADIFRWINDGQRQIVLNNENLLDKTAFASSVDGQQEYSLPSDILILRSVYFKGSGELSYFRIKGYKPTEFDEYIDGWDGTSYNEGSPMCYTIRVNKLIAFPIPESSITDAFKIYYNRKPIDVTLVGDTPDLPVAYHEALVKYCLAQAFEMDEDFEAAGAKLSDWERDVNLLRGREDWKNQETYSTITVLAEDRF